MGNYLFIRHYAEDDCDALQESVGSGRLEREGVYRAEDLREALEVGHHVALAHRTDVLQRRG